MNITAVHIIHLLTYAPRLAVPGLGCFVVSWRPAQYHENTQRFEPPRRVVELETNDTFEFSTSLIHSLCVREGMTDVQAIEQVNADVESMLLEVDRIGEYFLEGLGTLISDGKGVKLVPSGNSNCVNGPVLKIKPIEDAVVSEVSAQEKNQASVAIRAAASTAAAIVGFGIVALLTMFFSRTFNSDAPVQASMSNIASAREVLVQEHAAVSSPLVLVVNTPSDGAQPVEKPIVISNTQEDAYFLIVASLASAAEADSYCGAHSTARIPLTVLNVDGRFRISAVSGTSYQEVERLARENDIFSSYPSAWICQR